MSAPPLPSPPAPPTLPGYAELRCRSAFSFLTGASRPEELVERAHALGYRALALTDECSLAGIVRAHQAALACGLHLIVGAQFAVASAYPWTLVVLATSRDGYGNLCAFITRLRRAGDKGSYRLTGGDIEGAGLAGCLVVACPERDGGVRPPDAWAAWLLRHFTGRCWIGVEHRAELDDEAWLEQMRALGEAAAVPLVAVGDVRLHVRSRKPLHDVMTATRLGRPVHDCGRALLANAERHLRARAHLARLFEPDLLQATLDVAARCRFSLAEIRYDYPTEVVPAGTTALAHLRRLSFEGAGRRWPGGVPASAEAQLAHELQLIGELAYEHYFLTVHDIVDFARSRGILCQGRGSAANSVVCYCLGITEVDPARMAVLFERFVSRERNEPPDIDVDFEHERREEVIQYLYARYGRHRAALAATVVTYRPKSALRDVGRALGLDEALLARLSANHTWWDGARMVPERLAEAGLDLDTVRARQLLALTAQLLGLPRHLSQHTGGFVLTQGELSRIVPIENASMPERTVIQWDKDDLDAMGLLKVDVLALGMLSALRRALDLIGARRGHVFTLHDVPAEDTATYDMICRADTVGVFQIESRAQQQMLVRLKPRCFYDLVVEVAIVRPGPIQGGMVHPYLRRRTGEEAVSYPSEALRQALGRTMGVPVFQEQVMQVAILAAGFTPGEADELRRSMAAWRRRGGLERYHARIVDGMVARGYEAAFANAIFEQIKGFSEYGFPESHAASFALLVYASCWIKRHHPAEFLAALLNSQPMGFYTPSQLVQDARRHGVEVRPVDVMTSGADATMEPAEPTEPTEPTEPAEPAEPAVRLGLRQVAGLALAAIGRIVAARAAAPFTDADDLARRATLDRATMARLAAADALHALSGHRRQQVWDAVALQPPTALLRDAPVEEEWLALPDAPEAEEVVWDYAALGLTLRRHPLALLRDALTARRLMSSADLHDLPDGRLVRMAGLVTLRQAPPTARGTMFISLEDEFGTVQVIVWRRLRHARRAVVLRSRLLAVHGTWQRVGDNRNLVAGHVDDLTALLGTLMPGVAGAAAVAAAEAAAKPVPARGALAHAIGAAPREG